MSSRKCLHCGLVNFTAAVTCKRCNNDLAAHPTDNSQSPIAHANKSTVRVKNNYPVFSTIITIHLVVVNAVLAYGQSRRAQISSAETLGQMIGSVVAWPLILLIIYAVSRKFRERYALHTVINYGLALNVMINSMISLPR